MFVSRGDIVTIQIDLISFTHFFQQRVRYVPNKHRPSEFLLRVALPPGRLPSLRHVALLNLGLLPLPHPINNRFHGCDFLVNLRFNFLRLQFLRRFARPRRRCCLTRWRWRLALFLRRRWFRNCVTGVWMNDSLSQCLTIRRTIVWLCAGLKIYYIWSNINIFQFTNA